MSTPISASSLLTNDNVREAELKPRVLGVNLLSPLLAALLGRLLTLCLDALFLLESRGEALDVFVPLVGLLDGVALVRDEVRVRDTGVSGLQDLSLLVAFADAFDEVGVLGGL